MKSSILTSMTYLPTLSQPLATSNTENIVINTATPTFQHRQLQASPEAAENASVNDLVHVPLTGQL